MQKLPAYTQPEELPLTRDITLVYVFSLLVALVMTAVSAAGLIFRSDVYPTEQLQQSFVANDVVNLVIGLPVLLGSTWAARRGRLLGLLLLPGALFYVVYNYVAYLVAMPADTLFLLYLSLVVLAMCAIAGLLACINAEEIRQRLSGVVSERVSGAVLAGFGILFGLRAIGMIAQALLDQQLLPATELSVLIADLVIAPAWVIGGVLLWRRHSFGYAVGLGLLFHGSSLFLGLVVFLLLQPLLTNAPFALVDVLVILFMSLLAIIPFGLFVRGILLAGADAK